MPVIYLVLRRAHHVIAIGQKVLIEESNLRKLDAIFVALQQAAQDRIRHSSG
jgi:hypothetical protein